MANGAVRGLKIFLYLVVLGSTAALLYGFIKASSSVDRCLFGGSNCVLFAHMGKPNTTSQSASPPANCTGSAAPMALGQRYSSPVGYNEHLCRFCLASAASQLAVCIVASLVVYFRWSADKPTRTGCSVLELIVVVIFFTASLLSTVLIAGGLEVFCRRLLADWTGSYMHQSLHLATPLHCAQAPLFQKDNTAFYSGMHLARTCSFVSLAAWTLHLIISAISVHSYRKNGATPVEEVQSEKEKRRAAKEKKALKKKEKDLDKKKSKSKSGGRGDRQHLSAWDEGAEMV